MTLSAPYSQFAEGMVFRPPQSKASMRFYLAAGLVALDVLALIVAFTFADFLRFGTMGPVSSQYLLGAFLPIFLMSAGVASSHNGVVLLKRSEAVGRGLAALVIAAAVTVVVMFFLHVGTYVSRLHFAAGLVGAGVLLSISRALYAKFASGRLANSLYSVVELHDGSRSMPLGQGPSFNTSSFFDPANPTPESLDLLARLVANTDRVVVSCEEARRAAWAHVLQGMNVHGEILIPSIDGVRPLGIENFMGRTTLLVGRGPLSLGQRVTKRLFDIALALGAIMLVWPLLLLTALAIKLDSPGPVIFKQPRIGRQNRLFYVRKFRSMKVSGCDGAGVRSTARDDDRITRVGRFIRKTSIDELPQIFNILLGDMSVVGPRPHAVSSTAEDRLFWEIDGRYWHRHACKPGLTGLAQVRGFRGSTIRVKDITDRLASDLEYLARWSLWRDIGIVMRTVRVLCHRNAY